MLLYTFFVWRCSTTSSRRQPHLYEICQDLGGAWINLWHWCAVLRVRYRCNKRVIHQSCRRDKKVWLASKCAEMRDDYSENRNHYHVLLKGLRRWQPSSRTNYSLPEGQFAVDTAQLSEAWAEHWRQKLRAVPPHEDQADMSFECYTPAGVAVEQDAQDMEFSTEEILHTLRSFKFDKSSADVVHGTVLAPIRSELAGVLLPMFNQILRTAQIPACWRGAKVVAVPKPKEPTSCRPISLL
eukprot:6205072-Amphidinium_carterae.1